jgi:hypothetical protein
MPLKNKARRLSSPEYNGWPAAAKSTVKQKNLVHSF